MTKSDGQGGRTFAYERLGRQKVARTFLSAHYFSCDPATLAGFPLSSGGTRAVASAHGFGDYGRFFTLTEETSSLMDATSRETEEGADIAFIRRHGYESSPARARADERVLWLSRK